MHRKRVALAMLVATGLIAAGCGSDDEEPSSDNQPEAAQTEEKAEPKKKKGARAQMVDCIEGELGYEVGPDDGPHNLAVKSPDDKLQAKIIIHTDAGAARKAVAQTLMKGSNAVVFGRAEFIPRAASDTDSGVIANCVALEYNRPRR